ncbi:MAG: hypothetical protein PHT96_03460 [Syntrophorhabdaceae bacterium]|nr:hypothetical protein [Syntrophorhabdaceae bacterium]MDD4195457.1 hypothetical protein [Syntrophorhabdaceae bacterium]HOC45088.1 hypothetical protein [Syntrophorhabdaceae bacterium]
MKNPAGNAYVAYFDVLGFTSRFLSGDLQNRYEKLVDAIDRVKDDDITCFLFSDSIVIISRSFAKVRETSRSIYTWGILNDFWLRGAIAHGGLTDLDFSSFITRNRVVLPFLGEGYLKAYKLESTLNISGIALDNIFFEPGKECAALKRETDYVSYEEYLPKRGYEDQKLLLLPEHGSLKQIVDTMYFEEMLKSHVNDIDKYINTFIFFIETLLRTADHGTIVRFLDNLIKQLELHGSHVLIPSKVVIIFVAVIEGLIRRFRSGAFNGAGPNPQEMLETYVGNILGSLKVQGYLPTFVDYVLEYDKKRHSTVYRDINKLRADWSGFA